MITSVTTLPNGQVTTTLIPTLVTPRPSQVYVPTTALVEETGLSGPGSPKGRNLGVVVGAVIGGFIGLCLIILVLWYVRYVTQYPPHLPRCRTDFVVDEGGKRPTTRSFTSTRSRLTIRKLVDKPSNARKIQTENERAIRNPPRTTTVPCCLVEAGFKPLPPLQSHSHRTRSREPALVPGQHTWLRHLLTLRPWENLGQVLGRVQSAPACLGLIQ